MTQRRRFVWPGLGVVVPGLFGLLLLPVAALFWGVDRDMDERGVQTTGVVEMVDPHGWDAVSYFVGDKRYEIAEADALGHAVGATVVVVYDPDHPSYAVVQGDSVNENVHWWVLFVAAILLVVAAGNSGRGQRIVDQVRRRRRFDNDEGAGRSPGSRGRHGRRSASGVTAPAQGPGRAEDALPREGESRVAETEQRFVVYAASRKFARFAVFPAGLFLVVAAIVIPADEPMKFVAAVFGLPFLMWSWSVVWRRRVEVTEQNVTVVNVFSRGEVPLSELTDIEIDIEKDDEGTDYYLVFVTPSRRIRANMPYDNEDELSKVRARILQAREPLAQHRAGWVPKRPDDPETVASDVQDAATDQPERRSRIVDWLLFAFVGAFVVFLGLPAIFFLVVDALAGDWLVDHVPFWGEVMGFYDWLLQHAP